ncbi:MAG: small multi-drug export protein [Treponema sp.]|nr:small multi-drug export protein [Treponema sp.]
MIYVLTAILSLAPISELRGGIPYAMAHNIPWYIAWPFAAAINALVAPLCWLFLSTVHRLFYGASAKSGEALPVQGGFGWYRKIFDTFVERAREKLHKNVEKWGALGIAVFVAIPLPITGAWTGTLGAWVLGLSKKKTLFAVILGVITAGAIVTTVMLLGLSAFNIFVKTSISL